MKEYVQFEVPLEGEVVAAGAWMKLGSCSRAACATVVATTVQKARPTRVAMRRRALRMSRLLMC